MKTFKVKTVKPEAITSIEVSGSFLNALNQVLVNMIASKSEEEALEIFADIHDSQDDLSLMEDKTKDVYILMTLVKAIENSFDAEGKVASGEIEYDPTSSPSPSETQDSE